MKGIVKAAIENHSALNLCMVTAMAVGMFCFTQMRRETFPEFELDQITITVPYPGAAPQEVEQGIGQKIEEAVRSIEGVKKVTTGAAEGQCRVYLELVAGGRSPDRVLDEVRSNIDRIPSFPLEAEDPQISLLTRRRASIRVGVLGPKVVDVSAAASDSDLSAASYAELQLREVAERLRLDLLDVPEVAQIGFLAAKEFQIDIEIPEEKLRAHGLSLTDAADIIRRENRELPAGSIRSPSQEILLRGNNRRVTGSELSELPLVTESSGGVLKVGDLGTVRDEFADATAMNFINGRPALALSVSRSSSEDLFDLIDGVEEVLENAELPPGYDTITWSDESIEVRNRLNLLIKNGWQGLAIVFLLLMLFLEPRLAFWVALGIPFSLLTSGVFLYLTGQTLNQISMFAFVMALGIVVDDAIVVGENIHSHREMGKPFIRAAYEGTLEVIPSVTVAVLTTVIAFAPLLFVSGRMGKFTSVLPAAMIAMLTVSLIECLTILPSHLAHEDNIIMKAFGVIFYPFKVLLRPAAWLGQRCTSGLDRYIRSVYTPTLRWSLNNRLVVLSFCASSLILTAAVQRSGILEFSFFPKLDGNSLNAAVTFPDGTPASVTAAATRRIEDAFWRVADRYEAEGNPIADTSYRVIGASTGGFGGDGGASGSHRGSVEVELVASEDRNVPSRKIVEQWRSEVGPITGTEELFLGTRSFGSGGAPIEFKLLGSSLDVPALEAAVEECKERLAIYPGISDIKDDAVPGKWEYRFRIKPEAFATGVRTSDLAETVRAAYYGEEVMRVQRGRHEVKIMVTYPREDRRSLLNFDEIRVRTADGIERPITELAEVDVVRSYSSITRIDQARAITVSCDLDEDANNADKIVNDLKENFLPGLIERYPSVRVRWEGQQERRAESFLSMTVGFGVALMAMYVLLSIEFKSSIQPLMVMAIIPFGVLGAVIGHLLLNIPLTLFSLYGIIALTGIVINDSIVLIDFINARVRGGMPLQQALLEAGRRRFRPVLLTTVTTVGGLLPILLETSIQAQILIPMATSIAFGEIFATFVVLYLVPVTYSLYFDVGGRLDLAGMVDEQSFENDGFSGSTVLSS
ncbi:MAG: efflux RND transporter permease subunit [Planctomycetota bacterium]